MLSDFGLRGYLRVGEIFMTFSFMEFWSFVFFDFESFYCIRLYGFVEVVRTSFF